MQGIPLDPWLDQGDAMPDPDPVEPDQGRPPVQVCQPLLDECIGENVRSCDDTGTDYTITPCPMGTQCNQGACVTEFETCERSDTIALSHDALYFDVSSDGKPTSNVLTLTNCSTQELRIQKASILSAIRQPDERDVFGWSAQSAGVQGSVLAPGDALPVTIELRPRDPAWREDGTLYLSLQGAESLITREVELYTNSWCLGTPSLLDLGDLPIDRISTHHIPVHNCGTRTLLLSGSSLTQPELPVGKPWSLAGGERPVLIAPGDTHDLELSVTPEIAGPLTGQVELTFSPRDQSKLPERATRIPFLARSVRTPEQECTPSQNLTLLLDGKLPHTDDIARPPLLPYLVSLVEVAEDGTYLSPTLAPTETVRFEFEIDQSNISPFIISNESLFGPHAIAIPHIPGRYRIRALREFSLDGESRCEVTELDTVFTSFGDYTVALEWYATDDPIRRDIGTGHGADLDLHVRFMSRDGTATSWQAIEDVCTSQTIEQRCANSRGFTFNESRSGAYPELIDLYRTPDSTHAQIGVYANNMAGFAQACATVHIWRNDSNSSITLPASGESSSQCVDQDAMVLQRTDNFWLLGTLDLTTGEFDDSSAIIKSRGFPSN